MRHNLSVALALVEEYSQEIWGAFLAVLSFTLLVYSFVCLAAGFAYVGRSLARHKPAITFSDVGSHAFLVGAFWIAFAIIEFVLSLSLGQSAYRTLTKDR